MTPARPTSLTVVVPAHDEASGVVPTLEELVRALASLESETGLAWEVVVVDDGSTDGTGDRVEQFGSRGVRLLRHLRSRGYGAALKTGIRAARHDWILIIDADGTYPAEHIEALLRECGDETMVVGARLGANARVPALRRPAKWVLTRLASRLSGVRILDLNSGMRIFPRELFDSLIRILPDGFSFTSTITIGALASGWMVQYVPIDYRRREGRSKIRPVKDTLGFLSLIIRTVMYFDPLRVFLPLALVFCFASVAVGFGSYLAGRLMDVTTVVLLVAGIQLLALGVIADAINRRLS